MKFLRSLEKVPVLEKLVCVLLSVGGWPGPHMGPSLDHKTTERRREIKSLSTVNMGKKGDQGLQTQVLGEGKPGRGYRPDTRSEANVERRGHGRPRRRYLSGAVSHCSAPFHGCHSRLHALCCESPHFLRSSTKVQISVKFPTF